MCLGIPGQIVEMVDDEHHIAKAEVSGVRRNVNVGLLTEGEFREIVERVVQKASV